jgi:hypothetical protein
VFLEVIISKEQLGRFVFPEVIILCYGFPGMMMTSKYLGSQVHSLGGERAHMTSQERCEYGYFHNSKFTVRSMCILVNEMKREPKI